MNARWIGGLIAALSLIACEEPKDEAGVAGQTDGYEAMEPDSGYDEESVDEAAEASPDFSEGSVSLSLSGGAGASEETLSVSECMIVNDGANGVIRAGDGAFELIWSDRGFSVTWGSPQGLVTGGVSGSIDGDKVAFEGTLGETTIKGEVACD